MSLRPETVKWVVEMGKPATTSTFCTMEPAWPIYLTNHKAFNVQLMCQQICDYCPRHITSTSTTMSTITTITSATTVTTTSIPVTNTGNTGNTNTKDDRKSALKLLQSKL